VELSISTRETLPNDDWYKVRTIKKMLSGIASDGDIIDLRALSNGVIWGDTLVLTAPSEISISGNTRSFYSNITPLGDDKYEINVNTLSSSIDDPVLAHNWYKDVDRIDDSDETFTDNFTISSCVYFSVSGQVVKNQWLDVNANGSIIISIRETTLNTGIIGSWRDVFIGTYSKNNSSVLNFNNIYKTETKIEVKTVVYTGAGDNTRTGGSLIDSFNINYNKSDEVIESVEGGKATWMASEV